MQLITAQNVKDRYNVSDHKEDAIINASISAIENTYVKPLLTKECYAYLLGTVGVSPERPFTTFVMNGGLYDQSPFKVHINGLIDAVSALAFADLLIKNVMSTRYGTTKKTDKRSQDVIYTEAVTQVSRYAKIGKKYIEDVREYINTLDSNDTNLSDEKNIIELVQKNECYTIDGILNEWI